MCKQLHNQLSWLCAPVPENTSRKPSHDISYQLGVTRHRCSPWDPAMQKPFCPGGAPLLSLSSASLWKWEWHSIKEGERILHLGEREVQHGEPVAEMKFQYVMSGQWEACWVKKKKLKKKIKVCAAAGLRLGQSQKPAILVLLSNFDECWTALRMMDSVKRYIRILDRHLCIIVSTFSNQLQ